MNILLSVLNYFYRMIIHNTLNVVNFAYKMKYYVILNI